MIKDWIKRRIIRYKASKHAKKIMRSLHEAEEIHAGKRPAKSLNEFLKQFYHIRT